MDLSVRIGNDEASTTQTLLGEIMLEDWKEKCFIVPCLFYVSITHFWQKTCYTWWDAWALQTSASVTVHIARFLVL